MHRGRGWPCTCSSGSAELCSTSKRWANPASPAEAAFPAQAGRALPGAWHRDRSLSARGDLSHSSAAQASLAAISPVLQHLCSPRPINSWPSWDALPTLSPPEEPPWIRDAFHHCNASQLPPCEGGGARLTLKSAGHRQMGAARASLLPPSLALQAEVLEPQPGRRHCNLQHPCFHKPIQ